MRFICFVFSFVWISCNYCKKLDISKEEKVRLNYFKQGQKSYYRNTKGQVDTFIVSEIRNFYTPCNKIELSKYQFEIYDISFVMKSKSDYNNSQSLFVLRTRTEGTVIPHIYFDNLGPYRNEIENKEPTLIDTVLNNMELKSVLFYSNANTEQYGQKEHFKNFFWDKKKGLVAYTSTEGGLFLRIE